MNNYPNVYDKNITVYRFVIEEILSAPSES